MPGGRKTQKQFGVEPGSLAASKDPRIQRVIKRERRRAAQDYAAFERWTRAGCVSGLEDRGRWYVPPPDLEEREEAEE